MALTKDELLETISNMTVLELSELVKAMEEKFGVSAAAPVAVAAAPAQGGEVAKAEEKTSFDVVLKSVSQKIPVIKVVKTITGLGLKETKELVEGENQKIKSGIPKADAEDIKKKVEEAGATVEIV